MQDGDDFPVYQPRRRPASIGDGRAIIARIEAQEARARVFAAVVKAKETGLPQPVHDANGRLRCWIVRQSKPLEDL